MKCYIKGYNKSKYEADSEVIFQYAIENVKSFEVVEGEHNLNGYKVDKAFEDEYHEYLVLCFEDGTRTIYNNSEVDLFKH